MRDLGVADMNTEVEMTLEVKEETAKACML